MPYIIRGLDPALFTPIFTMGGQELAQHRAVLTHAGETGRYPCRVSLRDADPGEDLALVHFTNHDVETPYRSAFAIYVRKAADEAALYIDDVPPVLRARPIALRCYDSGGSMISAALSLNDDVDAQLRQLLQDCRIAYIDAHNAMHGCFAARIERYDASSDD